MSKKPPPLTSDPDWIRLKALYDHAINTGWTNTQIATRIGYHRVSLHHFSRGNRMPHPPTRRRLEELLVSIHNGSERPALVLDAGADRRIHVPWQDKREGNGGRRAPMGSTYENPYQKRAQDGLDATLRDLYLERDKIDSAIKAVKAARRVL